mgnify:CR=1 FL=1
MGFWQRPSIGWSLKCEAKAETNRTAFMKVLNKISQNDVNEVKSTNIQAAAICAMVATICVFGCALWTLYTFFTNPSLGGTGEKFLQNYVMPICLGAMCPLGLLIAVLVLVVKGKTEAFNKADIMYNLESFKGCGGDYITILETATNDMENAGQILTSLMVASWVMMGIILCNCIFSVGAIHVMN